MSEYPSHWEVKIFNNLVTLKRGVDLPVQQREVGEIPIYGSNGIVGFHSESTQNHPGIVTGRSGSIGNVYLRKTPFWALNTTLYSEKTHGNDIDYIYHFLKWFDLSRFSGGTGVPTLNRNDVHDQVIGIPPLPEQKKIAEILFGMDELIIRYEMRLAKNQQLMKAVLGSMLEKIEKDFQHSEKMIEEIFRETDTPESHDSATPLYSLTIESGLVPKPERYIRDFLLTDKGKDNYKQISKGDFVMNPMNLRWGAISTFREENAVKVSKYYTTFRAIEPLTSSNLYEFLFRSDRNLCLYERIATGSLIEKMRVHWSAFKKLKVPFPPFEKQQEFDNVFSSFESKNTGLKILIEKHKAFRLALASDLLSGRKRVSV